MGKRPTLSPEIPRLSLLAFFLFIAPVVAGSQQEHPAAHQACLAEERQALELGQGFGMALVADRSGFPGPRHILELKAELALTRKQENYVRRLFERMQEQAVAAGKKVLDKEAELESLFASGNPEEAAVRRLLAESASLRAELRWIHLSAHVAARRLLTSEQLQQYHLLRHGSAER